MNSMKNVFKKKPSQTLLNLGVFGKGKSVATSSTASQSPVVVKDTGDDQGHANVTDDVQVVDKVHMTVGTKFNNFWFYCYLHI